MKVASFAIFLGLLGAPSANAEDFEEKLNSGVTVVIPEHPNQSLEHSRRRSREIAERVWNQFCRDRDLCEGRQKYRIIVDYYEKTDDGEGCQVTLMFSGGTEFYSCVKGGDVTPQDRELPTPITRE